jgi:hypothetical protein
VTIFLSAIGDQQVMETKKLQTTVSNPHWDGKNPVIVITAVITPVTAICAICALNSSATEGP